MVWENLRRRNEHSTARKNILNHLKQVESRCPMDEYYYGSPARLSLSVTNLIAQACGIVVLSTHCLFQTVAMLSTVMQLFQTLFLFGVTIFAKSLASFLWVLRISHHDITFACLVMATSLQSMYWNLHCVHPLPSLFTTLYPYRYTLLALFSLQVIIEFQLRHTLRNEILSKSSLLTMLASSSILISALFTLPPSLYMLCIAEPFISSLVFTILALYVRDYEFITSNYYSLRLLPNIFIGYHLTRRSYHYIYALLLCYKIYIVCLALIKGITSFIVKRAIHHNFSLPPHTSPADQCSICLNDHNRDSCKLLCGHVVHSGCLLNMFYASAAAKCPLCRRPIQLRLYYELLQAGNYHILAFLIDMLLLFLFTPHIQYPNSVNPVTAPSTPYGNRRAIIIRLGTSPASPIAPRTARATPSSAPYAPRTYVASPPRVASDIASPARHVPQDRLSQSMTASTRYNASAATGAPLVPDSTTSTSPSSPPPMDAPTPAVARSTRYNTRNSTKRKYDESATSTTRKRAASKPAKKVSKRQRNNEES